MNTSKTIEELEAMSTTALMEEFGFNTPDNDRWAREDPWFGQVARDIILDSVAQRGCCVPELPDNSPPTEEQISEENRIKKVLDEWCPTPDELLQLEFQIRIMNVADRWLEEWRKENRESKREESETDKGDCKDDKIIKQEDSQSECDKKIKQEYDGPEGDKKIKQEPSDD